MKLVIIAGGKGTRLGRSDVPKPMVNIGDKTVLEHQLLLARQYGIRDVYIVAGHLASVIYDHFQDGSDYGLRITHIVEPHPLGTAGSVGLLRHVLDERFLLFYGDVMLDMDVGQLLAFDKPDASLGTLVVHPNDHPYDSDLLEVDSAHHVRAWHAKPHAPEAEHGNLVNAGVYVLSPEIFRYVPTDRATDFGRDIFPAVLRAGGTLQAYSTPEFIKDMGTPDRLQEISQAYSSGRIGRLNRSNRRRAVFLDRDGVIAKFVDNLSRLDQFELAPQAGAALREINRSEHLAVLVTNQPMIAKGFMTVEELRRIHARMETLLGREHAYLDAVYYCPHHPQSGFVGEVAELKIACECRKPRSGMLLQAAADLNIDLSASWIIGDHETDLIAGKRVGCRATHLQAGPPSDWADDSTTDLLAAVRRIVQPAEGSWSKVAA